MKYVKPSPEEKKKIAQAVADRISNQLSGVSITVGDREMSITIACMGRLVHNKTYPILLSEDAIASAVLDAVEEWYSKRENV